MSVPPTKQLVPPSSFPSMMEPSSATPAPSPGAATTTSEEYQPSVLFEDTVDHCEHLSHGFCVDCLTEPADDVNHPSHYTHGAYESIDIIEGLGLGKGFNRGNAMKYLHRAGHKGGPADEIKDLEKARWYLDREIARLKGPA